MKIHGELDGGEWSASRPYRPTSGDRSLGGWIGPGVGLDAVEKRKICLKSNPGRPACHYTNWAFPAFLDAGVLRYHLASTSYGLAVCLEWFCCWFWWLAEWIPQYQDTETLPRARRGIWSNKTRTRCEYSSFPLIRHTQFTTVALRWLMCWFLMPEVCIDLL
jgi:hypothetical protein